MSTADIYQAIDEIYEAGEGDEVRQAFGERNGIHSLSILTVLNPKEASMIAEKLKEIIKGKTVVEVGAGVGFLALELARFAEKVYAVEADPAWKNGQDDSTFPD